MTLLLYINDIFKIMIETNYFAIIIYYFEITQDIDLDMHRDHN